MPKLSCVNCLNEFDGKRASARYCSDKCRVEYNRGKKSIDSPGPVEKKIVEHLAANLKAAYKDPPKFFNIETADKSITDIMVHKAKMVAKMNARLAAKGLPLIQEKPEATQFIPTGIEAIDGITQEQDPEGKGGIPRKHVTEFFGPSGSGKTSIMKLLVQNTKGLEVLYVDAEGGLTNPPEHIHMMYVSHLESVENAVVEALQSHQYDLIIIDSVAMLTSEKEVEGDKQGMGAKPKAMAQFGRRVNAAVKPIGPDGYPDKNAKTAVVFINQLRDTLNAFGVKEYTPGGRTIEYSASLRLELRSASAEKIKEKVTNKMIGQKIRVSVKKSRFGNIGETFVAKLMYKDLK